MTKTKNGMFELLDAGNTLRNELEDNNTNWQVVEDELGDKLSTPLITVYHQRADCNQTLDFWSLSMGPNHPKEDSYWYLNTIFLGKAGLKSNRLQMAYGYSSDMIFYRRFYSGGWTDWVRVL